MITGHFGLALGARSLRRDAPLLLLLAASILPDVLDGVYAVARVCSPFGLYSHSLPAIAALAIVAAGVSGALTRRPGVALAVAAVILLHVPADWVTSSKVLWAGGPKLGVNLYRWPWADFLIELPVVVAGWFALRRSAAGPEWATRRAALVALIVLQAVFDVTTSLREPLGTRLHKKACDVPSAAGARGAEV